MSQHPFQSFMVRFAPGATVFGEGDPGNTMYIVQSGKIDLYRRVDGEKRSLGLMEKGDFFGEMSILEGLPRTNSAEAVEESELLEINSMIFDKMIRSNIEIAVRMLRKLSIRLREGERKLSELQASGARPARPAARPAAATAGPEVAPTAGARLVAEDGGATFALDGQECVIGRYDPVTEQKPDVDLTDLDLKRSVSRRHARVVQTEDGYEVIEEVGALNGTFVNGNKLVPGQRQVITDGDCLGIGQVAVIFRT